MERSISQKKVFYKKEMDNNHDGALTAYFGKPENACKLYAALGEEAYEASLGKGRAAEARRVIYTFLKQLKESSEDIRRCIVGEQDGKVSKALGSALLLPASK